MHAAAITRAPEAHRIGVITADTIAQAELEQSLGPVFDLRPLDSWRNFRKLMSDCPFQAVLADLDTLGMPPGQAIETLANARSLDQDLVLIAFTRVPDHELRLRAAQSRIDDLFVAPIDFRDMQVVIERALEKRSIEIDAGA